MSLVHETSPVPHRRVWVCQVRTLGGSSRCSRHRRSSSFLYFRTPAISMSFLCRLRFSRQQHTRDAHLDRASISTPIDTIALHHNRTRTTLPIPQRSGQAPPTPSRLDIHRTTTIRRGKTKRHLRPPGTPIYAHTHTTRRNVLLLRLRRAPLPERGGRLQRPDVPMPQLRQLVRVRRQDSPVVHALFYCKFFFLPLSIPIIFIYPD